MRTAPARITYVWIALSGLTVVAWVLALTQTGYRTASSGLEAAAVLAVAALKARLLIQEFMEVRTAPRWLRRFTDAWIAGLCLIVFVMYLS